MREIRGVLRPFRRPRRAGDALPGPVLRRIARYETQPSENPHLSRRLALGAGREAYVWPSAIGVCYTHPGKRGSGCFPARLLRELGVVLSAGGSGDAQTVRLSAIVADGIDKVEVRLQSGTRLAVRVRGNGFVVTLPGAPESVSWRTPDGRRHKQGGIVPPPQQTSAMPIVPG